MLKLDRRGRARRPVIPEEVQRRSRRAASGATCSRRSCSRTSSSGPSRPRPRRAPALAGRRDQGLLRRSARLPRERASSTSTRPDTVNISRRRRAQRVLEPDPRAPAARPRGRAGERQRVLKPAAETRGGSRHARPARSPTEARRRRSLRIAVPLVFMVLFLLSILMTSGLPDAGHGDGEGEQGRRGAARVGESGRDPGGQAARSRRARGSCRWASGCSCCSSAGSASCRC